MKRFGAGFALSVFAGLALAGLTGSAAAEVAPQVSARPVPRPAVSPPNEASFATEAGAFDGWITAFRPRAEAAGITPATLDAALAGAVFDADVLRRDSSQAEFTKTLWDYLDSAVSDLRVQNGRAALAEHDALLRQIETRYGVDRQVVVAIWGLESAYGTFRGTKPIIGSLATLASSSRRAAFFETQLIDALRILQNGDTSPDQMTGSWAGAMGHTQFMPGSFLALAVDWTGDGRRDIWSDDPADALASTAHYLAENGWTRGQPWGVEVTLPQGFDYAQADRGIEKSLADWAALGVAPVTPVPEEAGPAALLLPAGHRGVALLVFGNFAVLERYNTADAYVIGVGHLSDRILGAEPFQGGWPQDDRALTYDERVEMQTLLQQAGFDPQGIDGRIGPKTIDAVRAWQQSTGHVPDGYASLRVLEGLR
ncbi:lytic murein transglycosylase [Salipiger marinus]|uniref:lytic murein transglycosylase n=1 Tax=Salipiger marinus TaxID=555512 RepID=UPI0040592DE7